MVIFDLKTQSQNQCLLIVRVNLALFINIKHHVDKYKNNAPSWTVTLAYLADWSPLTLEV